MRVPQVAHSNLSREMIEQRVRDLGPWFHNIELAGVQTAPDHFLPDYPGKKWRRFAHALPDDLRGRSVLDIGCNAGFFSVQMKLRGAQRVLAIDTNDHFLQQGRFVAEVMGTPIEFRNLSVYDVASLGERFDIVLFMGVLYHLRHPLLALDLIYEHVAGDMLIFQSMQRGSKKVEPVPEDADFWELGMFFAPSYPRLHFVEHRYSNDPTNWWLPNRACVEAMLRSSGFAIESHPEEEVYICRRREQDLKEWDERAVYPARRGERHD